MAIPTQREELVAAGYVFDDESRCRWCGIEIEWWLTPKGAKMPFRVIEVKDTTKIFPQPILRIDRVPHFADCEQYKALMKRRK
jgi:hypothetical protein